LRPAWARKFAHPFFVALLVRFAHGLGAVIESSRRFGGVEHGENWREPGGPESRRK